ncbi:ABC transporter ATP-binding protein [Nitrospira sp.]|nr:ABC transporter ATP-binding protein [Nitrospira sp.]
MITVTHVCMVLAAGGRSITVLDHVSFEIPAKQTVAIVGPSGSGKSTLLGLMAGLDRPTSGSIELDGSDITTMAESRMARFRREKVGYIFQSFHLIPTLTAMENVAVPLELSGEQRADERAADLLAAVGLDDRMGHYPVQLSGGEQQRVAIARAFACRPPILLADEPTGNLDSSTGAHIVELLLALHRDHGTTLVLVTHDPALATSMQRVLSLRDGRLESDSLSSPSQFHGTSKAESERSARLSAPKAPLRFGS